MSTSSITSNAGQAAISALKTGSGIDIQTLATDLTNATKASSQSAIDNRKKAAEAQISSVAKVMNAVDTFLSSLNEIGDAASFQRQPFSSDATRISVDTTAEALPPDFTSSIEVVRLAREPSVRFASASSLDGALIGADGKSRTLTFAKGTSASPGAALGAITIDASTTLTSLRDQINGIAGLSAVIVNGGTAASPQYTLSVKGASGAENSFFATVENADASTLAADGLQSSDATITSGLDAEIRIDGLTVTSATNTFSSALQGIAMTVSGLTNGTTVSVGARTNTGALTTAAATVVSGFNMMLETVKAESAFDPDPTKRGGLSNNSAASSLLAQLRRFTTQPISGYADRSYTMAEIGIKTNRDGTLTLDSTAFAAVLRRDPGRVEAVLASKRSVADGRLSVLATSRETATGTHQLVKTGASTWTINGTAATLSGTTLTASSSSTETGLEITIPTAVLNAVPVGYATRISYSRGMLERVSTMLADLKDSQSSFGRITTNSKTALSKLETEQEQLDDRMAQLKARYLKQFAAMDSLVGQGRTTQDSLTNFMTSWSNSLKG
jgi:flagellar hook-associated protein 2